VGLGTGIAPFRRLLRKVYEERHWQGKVMLFHGARVGLETRHRRHHRGMQGFRRVTSPVEVHEPAAGLG
jgi:hypothetical protein